MYRTLPLVILLAACKAAPVEDNVTGDPVDPVQAVEDVDANVARINALGIVEVGELVIDVPDEAYNCYGVCPEWEDEVAAATEASAVRLEKLAVVVEGLGDDPVEAGGFDRAAVDADLARLEALDIVDVVRFVEEVPEAQANCYNLPCPEDIEAAEAVNAERAARLAAIVVEAERVCGGGEDPSAY